MVIYERNENFAILKNEVTDLTLNLQNHWCLTSKIRLRMYFFAEANVILSHQFCRAILAACQAHKTFKLPSLIYSGNTTGQPTYLRQLLSDYEPARNLLSSSKRLFTVNILSLHLMCMVADVLLLLYGTIYLIIFLTVQISTVFTNIP
jgi:hypothetical protein